MGLGLGLTRSAAGAGDDKEWTEDLAAAGEMAKKLKRPIMADFTGSDWCGFCIKLDNEVFSTKEFKDWSQKSVVMLKLDFPARKAQDAKLKSQNKELQNKYAVKGFPTIVFFDAEGKELGRIGGYAPGSGAEKWLARAGEIVGKAGDAPKK